MVQAGRHLVARGFGSGERIDDPHTGMAKAVLVPADDGKIVNEGRGRQEGVEGWHRLAQAKAAPWVGHPFVHRQEAFGEVGRETPEPLFQNPRLPGITPPDTSAINASTTP